MGSLEQKSKARVRRGQVERILLSSLAVAGIGLMAVAAPNTVKLLKKLDPEWIIKRDPKQRLREVASKLKRKGLIEFVEDHGRSKMRITDKGRQKLDRAILDSQPVIPRKWDKKWRLVIFDIPEKRRALRDKTRSYMFAFGFRQLQRSVWVYPYDCEELVTLLKSELKLGSTVLYIIADAIEYEEPIRAIFNLN